MLTASFSAQAQAYLSSTLIPAKATHNKDSPVSSNFSDSQVNSFIFVFYNLVFKNVFIFLHFSNPEGALFFISDKNQNRVMSLYLYNFSIVCVSYRFTFLTLCQGDFA
jgi:hypothetical protein